MFFETGAIHASYLEPVSGQKQSFNLGRLAAGQRNFAVDEYIPAPISPHTTIVLLTILTFCEHQVGPADTLARRPWSGCLRPCTISHGFISITDDMMATALTGPEVAEQYAAIVAG